MNILLSIALWLLTSVGWSASLRLDPAKESQDISDAMQSWLEPDGMHRDPEHLMDGQGSWQANRKSWGYSSRTLWLRIQLRNPTDQAEVRILSLPYASPTQADFFIYDINGRLIRFVEAGTFSPLEGRDLKLNLVGVRLEFLPRSEVTLLIRQQSRSLLDSHYVMRTEREHRRVEWIYLAAYGLYFGLVLALFFHNLSLYFSVRDPIYLYYLAWLLGTSAAMLFSSAYYALFWYRLPVFFHNLIYATPVLVNVGGALFIAAFLRLKLRKDRIGSCLLGLLLVSVGVSILHLYRPHVATPLNLYVNFAAIILYTWACVDRIVHGERYAWSLLVAVLCPMLAVLAYYTGNILFKFTVPSDLISFAFALEMLLISIGLAHRVYKMRQRQHQLETEQANLIYQAKMSALADMASGVAHEVNNPLMIINGYAYIIRRLIEQPLDKSKLRETTLKIDAAVDRIAFIVNALRSFARDELKDTAEPVSLSAVVQQALSLTAKRIQDHRIHLSLEGTDDPCWVMGYRPLIMDVLLTLLDNAMEAVRERDDKRILVRWQKVGNGEPRVRLIIQDSGPGVPPERRKQLFQPFFTTRPVGQGAGLSLSRSLGVVQSMQGRLDYERRQGHTCFIMELPLTSAPPANPQ